MNNTLYTNEQFHKSQWDGGCTTELAIFPESVLYREQNFIWRFSLADRTGEEMAFPRLPAYQSIILSLEGEAILTHNEKQAVKISRFQQDRFDGAAMTYSYGKMTAYNLTVRKGCDSHLDVVFPSEEERILKQESAEGYEHISAGFYCLSGSSTFMIEDQSITVEKGQLLVFTYDFNEAVSLKIKGAGEIVRAQIFYNDMVLEPEMIEAEKATFKDFKLSAKIALTRFRGSNNLFQWLRESWFDEDLKKGIAKIECYYLPFILWIAGLVGISGSGAALWSPRVLIGLLVLWTIVVIFLVMPLLYFAVLPKPIKGRIKRMDNLSEYEKGVLAREMLEKDKGSQLFKKQKTTGQRVYTEKKKD